MVVSGSPIASKVGREILQQGGNAVDAAVAVGFALAVVHPEAGNIGGGGFMVIRLRDGTAQTLDYRETAPARASRDMYLSAGPESSVTGHLSAGVPGAVAGLTEAHRRYGRLPFASVIDPAIRLAHEGFIIDEYRSRSIGDDSARLVLFPASRADVPSQRPAPRQWARHFASRNWPRPWRRFGTAVPPASIAGRVADLIVAEMARGGGLISREDLAGYRAIWREPVEIRYRGHTIYSMPPASSGGVTMGEILNIMEGYEPLPPFGSVALMHREAEAMRRAFTDRNKYLGDPGFVRNPVERLLSKAYAAELRQADRGARLGHPHLRARRSDAVHPPRITRWWMQEGNAVSCTTTLNNSYGSAVTVTGAGFLLNDEMDDFATSPGQPNMYGLVQGEANAIAPGKRMLSAMTPSIVLDPGKQLYLMVGTPGGPRIITMVYHVISNVIDHRMSLATRSRRRACTTRGCPTACRWKAGGFLPATLDSLRARGHGIANGGYWGDVEAIIRTPRGWRA